MIRIYAPSRSLGDSRMVSTGGFGLRSDQPASRLSAIDGPATEQFTNNNYTARESAAGKPATRKPRPG
jgi:hypothetical protein